MSEENQPISQHVANKVVRILQGKPMKFTCRLLFTSGEEIEFQTDYQPNLVYNADARENVLQYDAGGSGYAPLTAWSKVLVFRCEKNPV